MSKKSTGRLFQEHYEGISIVYPCILKHKAGNIEIFYENGVREFIGFSSQAAGYSVNKWSGAKDEYEFYIKRLIFVGGGVCTKQDWDEAHEKLNSIANDLMQLQLNQKYGEEVKSEDPIQEAIYPEESPGIVTKAINDFSEDPF